VRASDAVIRLTALAVVAVLTALGLLHVFWALGGRLGAAAAVPEVADRPAFRPSRTGTLLVAVALLVAASLVASTARLLPNACLLPFARPSTRVLGVLFLARSVGDFRLVGFFKRASASRFARLDSLVYAPLCLLLGAAVLYVASAAI
jgi:hypothetical protein